MAIWDKEPAQPQPAANSTPPRPAAPAGAASFPDPAKAPKERSDMKESVIASGLSIEGKIIGSGHVRVAGKFKGDVQVEGNLHIDSGARVEGQVRGVTKMIEDDRANFPDDATYQKELTDSDTSNSYRSLPIRRTATRTSGG